MRVLRLTAFKEGFDMGAAPKMRQQPFLARISPEFPKRRRAWVATGLPFRCFTVSPAGSGSKAALKVSGRLGRADAVLRWRNVARFWILANENTDAKVPE